MQTLSDLAAAGHTVVITAHQPRKEIWSAFDQILLLAKGGRTVYSGSTSSLFTFLESAGEVCPPNFKSVIPTRNTLSPAHPSRPTQPGGFRPRCYLARLLDRGSRTVVFTAD